MGLRMAWVVAIFAVGPQAVCLSNTPGRSRGQARYSRYNSASHPVEGRKMLENSIVDHDDLLVGYNVAGEVCDILDVEYLGSDDRAQISRADYGLCSA